MPLHARTAPAAALRTVLAALSSPPTDPRSRIHASHTAETPLTPELPLPVYVVHDLSRQAAAHLTGWRFLLHDGDHTVGTADAKPAGADWAFSHFGAGPYAASAERALRRADLLTGPYEPRLLSVPQLYMLTLWLHGPGASSQHETLADSDLIVPLAPALPGIPPEQPCRVDGLLPVLTHRLVPAPLIRTA